MQSVGFGRPSLAGWGWGEGTFHLQGAKWKFPLRSKMASPVAKETYSVFKEETLANDHPET